MSMFWGLVLFGLSGGALAQIISHGPCPLIETMKDFDTGRFVGLWHQMEWYHMYNNHNSKCATLHYSMRQNGTAFVGVSTVTTLSTGIQTSTPILYRAPDPNDPGKFKTITTWTTDERDWWILDTDYETYALSYYCINAPSIHKQYASILTREVKPSQAVMAKIDEIIKTKTDFNRALFKKVSHDNCVVQPVSMFTSE